MYKAGTPKNPELSSGGRAPSSTGFQHEMNVLESCQYQFTSWRCCERLCSASGNFFEDSFSVFAHFMTGDLPAHLSTLLNTQQFLTKRSWPPCPTLPIHLIWLGRLVLFPLTKKKPSKGDVFPVWKRGNKKMTEALKGIKIKAFKHCFEQRKKNVSGRCIASNAEYFEGDWSLNM